MQLPGLGPNEGTGSVPSVGRATDRAAHHQDPQAQAPSVPLGEGEPEVGPPSLDQARPEKRTHARDGLNSLGMDIPKPQLPPKKSKVPLSIGLDKERTLHRLARARIHCLKAPKP